MFDWHVYDIWLCLVVKALSPLMFRSSEDESQYFSSNMIPVFQCQENGNTFP